MVYLDDSGKDYGPLDEQRTCVFKRYTDRGNRKRQPHRPFVWMVDIYLADGMSAPDLSLEKWNSLNPDHRFEEPYPSP